MATSTMLKVLIFFVLVHLGVSVNSVKCRCPSDIDHCQTSQTICVYGITEEGDLFYNTDGQDAMNLTRFAIKRRKAIENMTEFDDINAGLYVPRTNETTYLKPIFFVSCKNCKDFHDLTNFKESDIKVFLLSLYVQRMKSNLKYHIAVFDMELFKQGKNQRLPIIATTPFWTNRLHVNTSCATLKHFIPHFAGQRSCVLDYKSIYENKYDGWSITPSTTTMQMIVSWTLSSIDLYNHGVLPDVVSDFEKYETIGRKTDANGPKTCRFVFEMTDTSKKIEYFCVCGGVRCLENVFAHNSATICPSVLYRFKSLNRSTLAKDTKFLSIEGFFLNSAYECWTLFSMSDGIDNLYMRARLRPSPDCSIPLAGYTFRSHNYHCIFSNSSSVDAVPVNMMTLHFDPSITAIRQTMIEKALNHYHIKDMPLLGANCNSEGALSHSEYSQNQLAMNSSYFPCFYYTELNSDDKVFPLMGINMAPIETVKGKTCYYLTVKLNVDHLRKCPDQIKIKKFMDPAVMTLISCPIGVTPDLQDKAFIQELNQACPESFWNEKESKWQWKYVKTPSKLCAQIVTGLVKKDDRIYVPEKFELRGVDFATDFINTTFPMNQTIAAYGENERVDADDEIMTLHGCGFNVQKNLTICTCSSILGGCNDLYTIGKLHVLKYLPLGEKE